MFQILLDQQTERSRGNHKVWSKSQDDNCDSEKKVLPIFLLYPVDIN